MKKRMLKMSGLCVALLLTLSLFACAQGNPSEDRPPQDSGTPEATEQQMEAASLTPLPAPSEGATVDANINQETIDQWLNREDVAYRDARMIYDPADFASVGGKPALTQSLPGFKIVPYPFLGTLPASDIPGMYAGETLYEVTWDGEVITGATPNYEESLLILEELFPKDRAIFIMCGGGKYAEFTKLLLVELGWDADLLYNIGANWAYEGIHAVVFTAPSSADPARPILKTWLMDYAFLDFSLMHEL